MIQEIRMTNFKCFVEQSLTLSEMTVFAGANAAGKSSAIQALLLATAQMRGKTRTLEEAFGDVQVGAPQVLVSQTPKELEDASFILGITGKNGSLDVKYSIDKLQPLKLHAKTCGGDLPDTVFYLNAERVGSRISYPASMEDSIASDGSNAAYLIDRADIEQRRIPVEFAADNSSEKFSVQVEQWMKAILGDVNFSVSTNLEVAMTDIRYGNSLTEKRVLPTMTGFGISYILPIVTAGLWCMAEEDSVAQSQMGKFLQIVSSAGVQVIVETHSEHIIDGARIQAALMGRTDKMKIDFFSISEDGIKVRDIKVNRDGELSEWPQGFFDQKSQDLRELFQIRRQNAGK